MRYTIAGILVVAAGLLTWVVATGGGGKDIWFMMVAIVSVVFFASVGNLWNSMYKGKKSAKPPMDAVNVVRVSDPSKGRAPVAPASEDRKAS